ncbi:MAG: hypothetical protein M0Z66_14735 [Thermaerobacter sp.]|nr:hypothetical protein [Thermaerobacter sp.]
MSRAKEPEAVERVRWAYAVFVPEESLEGLAGLLNAEALPPEVLSDLLAAMPPQAIQGVDAVRRASQQDPQLRRALRDARQALRKGSVEEPPK